MTAKPLLQTRFDIEHFYKVDTEAVDNVIQEIDPAGTYGNQPLYPRAQVEAALKRNGLR